MQLDSHCYPQPRTLWPWQIAILFALLAAVVAVYWVLWV